MKDLNTNLLRYHQREQLQSEISQAESMLPHAKPDDKGTIVSNMNRTKKQLQAQSPEPLTPKEKDKLASLEKKLRSRITTNMPTAEVMRKNPAGAVDWHQKWEKANKKLIRMWKNIRIQLNPDSTDRDLSNIERYRPSGAQDRFRSDAQIPGVISYSSIPDELWPFDAPQNTAAAQAQKRYDDEHAENDVNKALEEFDDSELPKNEDEDSEEDGRKKPLTAEQQAVLVQRLANARAALAKKRAEEKQLDETLEAVPVTQD